jgi:hypothetical protein
MRVKTRLELKPAGKKFLQGCWGCRGYFGGGLFSMENSYDFRVKEWLNKIQPEFWKHLDKIPSLPEDTANEVLCYFIELACKPQNIRPITIGREAISEMPLEWVLSHIEGIVKENINLEDDWEYRRLAELYLLLDSKLVQHLVAVGLKSNNPDVIEAAHDYSAKL